MVDLDGIVANLLDPWLAAYNRDWDDCLTVELVDSWHIWECVKPECGKQVLQYLNKPGFFDKLELLPGAALGVSALVAQGHEIRFVTTAANADSARAKIAWVKNHFGDSYANSMFICRDKHFLDGDLLIDDKPENLEAWKKSRPLGLTATILYPYNEFVKADCVAEGYWDTAQAWLTIANFCKDLKNLSFLRKKA